MKNVVTIDSKHTRCHDDALSIKLLSNGNYLIEISIADVAQLIKSNSSIDQDIRERDETIYIKNYYQPMVSDSLKKLLSLRKGDPKITFTVRF